MKYFSKVLIVLVLAVCVGLLVYSVEYRQDKEKEKIVLTTVKIENGKTTEKKDTRELIAENKEGDFKLYKDDGTIILSHNGREQSFANWYTLFSTNEPKLYYGDYDNDKEKELAIVIDNYSATDEDKKNIPNSVVVVKALDNESGDNTADSFEYFVADTDTWKNPFNRAIKSEVSQLKLNKRYIQYTMDNYDSTLNYDEKTGIASNKYVYFALAEKTGAHSFATLDRWTRGNARYSIDKKGDINLEIRILAYYKELAQPQDIGYLKMKVWIKKGKSDIIPNTISFVTSDKYYCPDPRDELRESWKSTINNSAAPASETEKSISWIDVQFALDTPYEEATISFYGMESQIKNVDKVELTEKSVTLYAKEGYNFSKKPAEESKFSVTINNGEKTQYDISEKCAVKKDGDISILTIEFDKTYNRDELKGIRIKYGA